MMLELDQLEEKVRVAAELLARLKAERRSLEAENKELRDRLKKLEPSAGRHEELKPRLKALEEERSTLLDERRVVARRVEEMLAKLEVLQKAVQA
jgi:chromosome segregation ATPase